MYGIFQVSSSSGNTLEFRYLSQSVSEANTPIIILNIYCKNTPRKQEKIWTSIGGPGIEPSSQNSGRRTKTEEH